MQTLTEQLVNSNYRNRLFTASQLDRLLDGHPERRYQLVNRALKAGELTRFKRGLYRLSPPYQEEAIHSFVAAQALLPGSYVSMETALSHHGWIPEAVYTTVCITPHRKSLSYHLPEIGHLQFHPLAIKPGSFLELVQRVEFSGQHALVASPLRALMDLVCYRKLTWQGLEWFEDSLRIDPELLRQTTKKSMKALRRTYRHKRVQQYLESFARELGLLTKDSQ